MEHAGFEDIGGWLSKRDAPELSTFANEPYDHDEFVVSEWIDSRNLGRLGTPKKEFKQDLIEMNKEFCKFHENALGEFEPNDLSRKPNVINDFAGELIQKWHPKYSKILLARFARGRSHFRKR